MAGWRLFGRRVAAYGVDIALLFAVLFTAGWLVQRALGVSPATGFQVWVTLLFNFSLPTWAYFTIADASAAGATFGKRWLRLRASRHDGGRIGLVRALGRTATKLLPWELTHVSVFALETQPGQFSFVQGAGLTLANVLMFAYLACAAATRGRRSVHDLVAGTAVDDAA